MSKIKTAHQILLEISKAKLVIFDFDGTIVRLNVDWKGLKRELKEYCKRKYGIETIMSPLNQTIVKISERIDRNFKRKADEIIKKYELAHIEEFERNEEVIKLINTLKRRKKLAIFSNNCLVTINIVLNKICLKKVFNPVISREMVIKTKPHPDGLKEILESYPRINKSEVIFIGNRTDDKIVGENVGLKTIILKNYLT